MLLRTISKTGVQIFTMAALVATSFAANSAQDTDISVDPVIHLFPATTLNTDSVSKVFTVKNRNASTVLNIGTLTLGAPHADQYILLADNCSSTVLTANGGTCTVSVKYHPTRSGSMSATLLIPSSATQTPTLTAFVTTNESATNEATRRLPPVLSAVSIPPTITSNTSTTITWSALGYDSSYLTNMVVFNCAGISNGSCGNSYGDANMVYDSGSLAPVSSGAGNWTFSGVTSKQFNYSHTFTAPTVAVATDFVIRFYDKSQGDTDAAKSSLSLLVPGGLSGITYYAGDTSGRRIVKSITP